MCETIEKGENSVKVKGALVEACDTIIYELLTRGFSIFKHIHTIENTVVFTIKRTCADESPFLVTKID